ncbi:HYR domain-containing protein [Pyxidicoccus fallax]|uniref:HYR domain-containing protein n=1 Tax=Pyxidicoccus fallax TaxID=394095 RepID=A0A848LZY8_9BACT|nr:FG-GAP-like repeat-containing protein [Pyxidicoccus fallax]NMO23199.1 HYR domain-containing protein [Pyxidicoccus fallax]NPC86051.1 HYR domain-containing protein [Pyxidicoccus fallax]
MQQGWTDRRAGRWVVLGTLGLVACAGGTPEEPEARVTADVEVEAEARCEVRPPFEPNFEPEVEWAWTASPLMPTHTNVNMTPVVVDVSGDGVPDVVFNSFESWNFKTNGVLRAISGADGSDLWAVTDPALRVRGSGSVAAGDIDGDGKVELCTVPEDALGIICFEHTGAFKFRAAGPKLDQGGVSLADLEGDGTVEIIAGNHVYDSGGALKWVGEDGVGGPPAPSDTGPLAFAADLDGDGRQEVVNGRAIYRHDGTLRCRAETLGHGLAAVGNFDADPAGEVVVAWEGNVSLMEDDCTVRWTVERLDWGVGGPPNIADFDGDGQAEVGVAGADWYSVFEADGTERWRSPIQDHSSNRTGSTTFDFEGDGRTEVVYADERALRILDGVTGAVRFETPHSSCTAYENPVVADVDADGNAEVVVAQNTACDLGAFNGIRVFRDKKDGWVNTRPLWNQHAYSVTNVADDGSIPARPAINWRTPGLNTFRTNSQGTGTVKPFAAPDLVVGNVTAACDGEGGVTLGARVRNLGDAAASAGVRVAFYRGPPGANGTLLGVATVADKVDPGAEVSVALGLGTSPGGRGEVFAVVDDDGAGTGRELECREDNNVSSARVSLECEVTTNEPPVAVCRDVTVSADETCRAVASVDDGSHDPDGQPGPFTVTQAAPGPFGLGRHPVTLTASDGEASAVCTGTVTVVDTTLPHIVCPQPQVLECTAGGARATYTARAEDNCGPVSVTCTPPTGATFPLGRTEVDCNATDGSGNACGCAFTVTVKDTRPPVLGGSQGVRLLPADHQYRTVTLAECAGVARDACAGELPLERYGRIVRVTSDESEDVGGVCDGATCDDVDVRVNATSVRLRAERDDTGDGRVYTVHYVVEDPSGNKAEGRCTVDVPRDTYGRLPAQDSGPKYCVGQGCPSGMGGSPLCP